MQPHNPRPDSREGPEELVLRLVARRLQRQFPELAPALIDHMVRGQYDQVDTAGLDGQDATEADQDKPA